jgi:exopolysaccharide biosynthesis predicted pyruvyltransferase EpsI
VSSGNLVQRLRDGFVRALHDALPPDSSVALLDIPRFANVGDNAILLGEVRALRVLERQVLHVATDGETYDREVLRRRIGSRPILLHGGGNLGDLWPWHQRLRERLLADFPGNDVIQLPQSIAFDNPESMELARSAFSGHPRFTLLVRDAASQKFAETHLGLTARLVPDAAFGLGPLRRPAPPTRQLLVLARTDQERRAGPPLPPDVTTEDWIEPMLGPEGRRARRVAVDLDARDWPARVDALSARASAWAWSRVSTAHLRHGLALLGSANVVVTDRLHAHVLSLLLGIPHFVTDNVSGKIRGLHDAWTHESDLVTWCASLEEGVELARQ